MVESVVWALITIESPEDSQDERQDSVRRESTAQRKGRTDLFHLLEERPESTVAEVADEREKRVLEWAWRTPAFVTLLGWSDLLAIGSFQTWLRQHLIGDRYFLELSRCSSGEGSLCEWDCARKSRRRGVSSDVWNGLWVRWVSD